MRDSVNIVTLAFLLAVLPVCAGAAGGVNDLRPGEKLVAPETGSIPVAFVLSPGATVIDFAGPWEVFQDVSVPGRAGRPFRLFTVSETLDPIRATAGLRVLPDYTIADAPDPKVIVIGAQRASPAVVEWIRRAATGADITMSVCTGSFILARTGLLDGRAATTHHDFLDQFAGRFPDIDVRTEVRYVEGPRYATAAGLTSGVDLSLRVVERYFGTEVAERTAAYMEHSSDGWRRENGFWDGSKP